MCPTSLKYETAGFRSKSALHLELMRGTLLLALFIFVHRNKNEPKNARPAKLAPLKQYQGACPPIKTRTIDAGNDLHNRFN